MYSFIWDSINWSVDFKSTDSENGDVELQESWNALQQRIFSSCSRIWDAVQNVLCNESPEGHLPQDLDDDDTVDTKDILSYSFRAIHESR